MARIHFASSRDSSREVDVVDTRSFVEPVSRVLEVEFDSIDTADLELVFCGIQVEEYNSWYRCTLGSEWTGLDNDFAGGIGSSRVGYSQRHGITSACTRPRSP